MKFNFNDFKNKSQNDHFLLSFFASHSISIRVDIPFKSFIRITHSWGSLLSMIIKETNKCVEKNERKSLAMGCPFIYCAHIKYQVPSNNDLCVITTIRLVFKKFLLMIDKNYEFYEKWLWDDFLIICQNICFKMFINYVSYHLIKWNFYKPLKFNNFHIHQGFFCV